MDNQTPSQETLDATLAKWLQRLRLQDWRIEAEFISRNHIKDRCLAEINPNRYNRSAKISLAPPSEWQPYTDPAEHSYWEANLVHELLHIYWVEYQCFEEGEDRDLIEERACNDLATALVELSQNRKIPDPAQSQVFERAMKLCESLRGVVVSAPPVALQRLQDLQRAVTHYEEEKDNASD